VAVADDIVNLTFAWLSSLSYSRNVAACCVLPMVTKTLSFFWKRCNDVVADAANMVSSLNVMLNPEGQESIEICFYLNYPGSRIQCYAGLIWL